MPLGPGVRYRWKTYPNGRKVRLAFKGSKVIEAKSDTGAIHTPEEFAADAAKQKKRKSPSWRRRAMGGA